MSARYIRTALLVALLCAVLPSMAADPKAKGKNRKQSAHLLLEEASFHFGDVQRHGGDLRHTFVVRNDGDAPLLIYRTFTSCSCLKATHTRRPIAPGEEGAITVIYAPEKSDPGVFNKVVHIYSNASNPQTAITIQGHSHDPEFEYHD